jgi:uncharacterized membrane protein YgdD (TMEM256/DUF423 family)
VVPELVAQYSFDIVISNLNLTMDSSQNHTKFVQLAYVVGTVLMLLAVALGAFGAHALGPELRANGKLAVFNTANKYHFIHALALLIIAGVGARVSKTIQAMVVTTMLVGIVLFSGSLYLLAVFDIKQLGLVTPLGGLCLLLAWFFLLLGLIQNRSN